MQADYTTKLRFTGTREVKEKCAEIIKLYSDKKHSGVSRVFQLKRIIISR